MITSSREPRKRTRVLRLAIAGSVIVHLLLVLLMLAAYDVVNRISPRLAVPRQPQSDEIVTLSSAIRIERRSRPVPSHPAPPARTRVTPRREKRTIAQAYVPPAPAVHHELSKRSAHATPVPRITAPPATAPPTSAPQQRRSPPERRVALVPRVSQQAAAPAQRAAQFSPAQIAAIQSDLAHSIAADRGAHDPLSDVARPVHVATTTRRSAVDFSGVDASMNGFEGLCEPLKSWPSGSYVYFYLTCRVVHDDGLVREEALPWPVRYPARRLSYGENGPVPPGGAPVPPPLPGWRPNPAQRLDPDVIEYLRKNGYSM